MSLFSSSADEYNVKSSACLFSLIAKSWSISSTRQVTVLHDKLFFFKFVLALRTQNSYFLYHGLFEKCSFEELLTGLHSALTVDFFFFGPLIATHCCRRVQNITRVIKE